MVKTHGNFKHNPEIFPGVRLFPRNKIKKTNINKFRKHYNKQRELNVTHRKKPTTQRKDGLKAQRRQLLGQKKLPSKGGKRLAGKGKVRLSKTVPKWYPELGEKWTFRSAKLKGGRVGRSIVRRLIRQKRNPVHRPLIKVRKNITPGTVLILLLGKFRGRRVIFLKQMRGSGHLLITGPYKINGVPMRRVDQRYVISTSTKLDLKDVMIPEKINDRWFRRNDARHKSIICAQKKKTDFFGKPKKRKRRSPEVKEFQMQVDNQILPVIKKTVYLQHYLKSKFSLKPGQAPHKMKF